MSDSEYCKMLEMPINTCDVVVKPNRRKRKAVVKEVIEKVNEESLTNTEIPKKEEKSFLKLFKNKSKENKSKVKKAKIKKEEKAEVVKNRKFDIISVQITAIFVLIVGIILTNIFWEDSGMNNLLRSVFGTNQIENNLEYTAFSASVPSKNQLVSVKDGVMTVNSGSVYSPCDGEVESVVQEGDTFVITVKHSSSFSSVFTGLEFCYAKKGDNVYSNIPLGYSSSPIQVSMYDDNLLLTNYNITGDNIVWLN